MRSHGHGVAKGTVSKIGTARVKVSSKNERNLEMEKWKEKSERGGVDRDRTEARDQPR
jgi:hypothetical protein